MLSTKHAGEKFKLSEIEQDRFINNVNRLMDFKEITTREMAAGIGRCQAYVVQLLNRSSNVNMKNAMAMAAFLEAPNFDDLISRKLTDAELSGLSENDYVEYKRLFLEKELEETKFKFVLDAHTTKIKRLDNRMAEILDNLKKS